MADTRNYGTPPSPPSSSPGSASDLADLFKAQYSEELDAWLERYKQQLSDDAARMALEATRYDTARAADTALVQALHTAYVSTSQSAIDRSLTRVNVVTTSIGAVTTVYTGLLALVYAAKSDSGEALTGVAIIPAIFLALALLLVATYAAMFRNSKSKRGPLLPSGVGGELTEYRLETFMSWCFAAIGARVWALHAGIVSMGFGISTLPLPFITLPDGLPLAIMICGLLAVLLVAIITAANSTEQAETPEQPDEYPDTPAVASLSSPQVAADGGNAMALDTSKAYRLTTDTPGSVQSLDGTIRLTAAPGDDGPGQRWWLQPQDGGTYGLTTEALGPCYAIDVTNDGTFTPVLVPAADFTGQMWHVEPLDGGAFRLRSEFPGDEQRWLGVDEHGALVTRPGTAQRWRLTPLAPAPPAPAESPVPQLCPGRLVAQGEGHADFTLYLVPRGVLRAVVIFADFDDAPGEIDPAEIGARVHGSGAATQLYHDQSYGALGLEVTVRSDLGWRRLPNPSTAYDFGDGGKQRQFMTDIAARIGAGELRFDDYDLVLAVTAYTTNVGLSPAYHHRPGDGAPSASGEILHGVTFGYDLYDRDYRVLVHELGHVMGLPDLYPYEPGERRGTCRPAAPVENLVGYWDLMSDVDHGEHFLGWHRHKHGWLPPARSTYIDRATTQRRVTLYPLSGPDGLSMVVVPCDDVRRPRKVLVVEPAEPLQDLPQAQGVLIYSVDAGIDGGDSPVAVRPPEGQGLDNAPYRVGNVADIEDDNGARLSVKVISQTSLAWDVEISFTPAPQD